MELPPPPTPPPPSSEAAVASVCLREQWSASQGFGCHPLLCAT